jgi:ribosomal protein S18 acetylase RimI-like enzyme/glycosyltransferase involved in cell wall biosynthesis
MNDQAGAQGSIELSIIASIHNEKLNLPSLVSRIVEVMRHYPHVRGWELIMVDDASTDGSWSVMEDIREEYPEYVRLEQHPQRLGQKGCFMTGFEKARGWLSVLMDADLQVLPEELPMILDKAILEENEIVCTYNDPKRGGKTRGIVSRIGNVFMKLLFRSPVIDAGANFMGIQTRYVRGVKLVRNDQRYLLPISMRRGLTKIGEVGVIFSVRGYGKSKYSKFKKAIQGVPEMLTLKIRLLSGVYDRPPVIGETREERRRRMVPQLTDVPTLSKLLNEEIDSHRLALDIAKNNDARTWVIMDKDQIEAFSEWVVTPWESGVLQRKSGAFKVWWAAGGYLDQQISLVRVFGACIKDCKEYGIRFLSLRLSEDDRTALHAAESVGFKVLESYLSFTRSMEDPLPVDDRVRAARPEEMEPVAELAARTFRYNRFMSDSLIPDNLARHSRAEWVRNSFKGRAEAIYVAEEDGRLAGFLLLKSKEDSTGRKAGVIDLIAVDSDFSGKGLGMGLVAAAIHHYKQTADCIEVGTQAKNIPAVNLYIKSGFRITKSEFTLHHHLN